MNISSPDSYEIVLKNCSFFGYHGVLPQEKEIGQRFFVDAVLTVGSLEACKTGNLSSTVDYGAAFKTIEKLVTGASFDLIEHLAHTIAQSLLSEFPPLLSVHITVRKPSAPVAGILDYIETSLCLPR